MSDLTTNDSHGGVTDDDLEKWLSDNPNVKGILDQWGAADSDSSPEPEPVPDATPAEPGPPEPGSPDEGADDDSVPAAEPSAPESDEGEDEGGEPAAEPVSPAVPAPEPLDAESLAQLIAIRDEIASSPELQARIRDYYAGTQTPTAEPTPTPVATPIPEPTIPAEYLDDPAVAAIYGLYQSQAAELAQLRTMTQQSLVAQQEQIRANTNSIYERAAKSFGDTHNLTPDEVATVSQIAARLNVLPALLQGLDPITNLPSRPDPLTAVERALSIAYTQTEFAARDKTAADERAATSRKSDDTRKKKLAAISGSSGSIPRTPAKPSDPKAAMVQEVSEMFDGTWIDD